MDQLRERLSVLIDETGLATRKQEILASAKPSIRLSLETLSAENAQNLSYIGGMPCLPEHTAWPVQEDGAPLSPIAQINLADLAPGLTGPPFLPSSGLLHFFCDMEDCGSNGYRHDQTTGWRVLHTAETGPATFRHQSPGLRQESARAKYQTLQQAYRRQVENGINAGEIESWEVRTESTQPLPQCPLRFQRELTIPAFRSIEILALDLENSMYEPYTDLQRRLADPGDSIHRMFGHPDAIQGCMQRTAQFITNAAYLPKDVYSYYEHPRANELMPGAHDWTLLFQLDSNQDPAWMWGDWGKLFFWIKKQDLAAGAFDKTWYFMQCG